MRPRHLFTAFGIPVAVDPLFILWLALVYQWAAGGTFGVYVVGALTFFVLVHEFGHALTAKRLGVAPRITIGFLGGFAGYVSPDHFTRRHRAAITIMGPLTQLVVAVPLLALVLLRLPSPAGSDEPWWMFRAVSFAGVSLAFANLFPAWPLDGGHLAEEAFPSDSRSTSRLTRPLLIWSVVVSLAMATMWLVRRTHPEASLFAHLDAPPFPTSDISVAEALWHDVRGLPGLLFGRTIFIPLFILHGALLRLVQLNAAKIDPDLLPARATSGGDDEPVDPTLAAERRAWADGSVGDFPDGAEPSPWLLAHLALAAGDRDGAVEHLRRLGDQPRRWKIDVADRPEIAALLDDVPSAAGANLAVLEARVHHGPVDALLATATELHLAARQKPITAAAAEADVRRAIGEPLVLGAAGLAVRGQDNEAMKWLRRSASWSPDPARLVAMPEFDHLRGDAGFQQLFGGLQRQRRTRSV